LFQYRSLREHSMMHRMNENKIPQGLQAQLSAHWDSWLSKLDLSEIPERHKTEALRVWQASEFAVQVSLRQAKWLLDQLQRNSFSKPHQREVLQAIIQQALQAVQSEEELMRLLRELRQQQMLRIVWREMAHTAELEETLTATSDLADLLVSAALDWLMADAVEKSGQPRSHEGDAQAMVVLGMGKLGGSELNFSSDIDLIFAYPEKGQTDGERSLTNEQFFTRLGQRLIKSLDQMTGDGFVYRVDMRLRPFGDSGALVQHFDGIEHYYEVHGREWERYALIKARPVAGDLDAGLQLLDSLRGFIYRRYLDYGVIESLRDMKAMIAKQAAMRGKEQDLKLGPGGIREIEFIVQMFQLIHGGRHRQLQQQSLLPCLEYIQSQSWLTADEKKLLEQAYRFLRRAENHVQMQNDRQVHALPEAEQDQLRLSTSLGFPDWTSFLTDLDAHRQAVIRLFQETFNFEQNGEEESDIQRLIQQLWAGMVAEDEDEIYAALEKTQLDDKVFAHRSLLDFMRGRTVKILSEKGRQRLYRLMPLLLTEIISNDLSSKILARLLGMISQIAQRSSYVAFLTERPQTLRLLIRLCNTSDWITDYLTQHPILLDELLDPLTLFAPPAKEELRQKLNEAVNQIDPDDQEGWLNQLRHFKQAQVLRVAASDIMEALPLMRVSDQLTWIAEVVLEQVLERVWAELTAKHGEPLADMSTSNVAEFTIIGYGKLGGLEIGYGSDLDLVFLHNAKGDTYTNGEKPQPTAQFFARLGQRIISVLNTFTTSGVLYEVDMRLRPSGNAGLLVSNLDAFLRYQLDQAWLWEHQALVRARPVAGSENLAKAFNRVREEVLASSRDSSEVAAEVVKMRQKMWQAHAPDKNFDLKKSPGGITDIEFMVQYLVLAHAHDYQPLVVWTDNIRILEALAETGVIEAKTAARLADIYRHFRDAIHRLTLL